MTAPGALRRLLVNADDCGMHPAITAGILAAHRGGIVTSTSVVATPDADLTSVARALPGVPDLGVGLHLNLSWGRPSAPAGELGPLVEDGRFRPAGAILHILDSLDPVFVRRELEAQLASFEAALGRAPDHLDYHQHLVCFSPEHMRVVLEIASRHGLPVRSVAAFTDAGELQAFVVRIERENGVSLGLGGRESLAERAGRLRDVVTAFPGLRTPDRVQTHFYGSTATLDDLLKFLHTLPEGTTELMCHPALPGAPAEGYDGRAGELVILTDPRARQEITARNIQLVRFRDL